MMVSGLVPIGKQNCGAPPRLRRSAQTFNEIVMPNDLDSSTPFIIFMTVKSIDGVWGEW